MLHELQVYEGGLTWREGLELTGGRVKPRIGNSAICIGSGIKRDVRWKQYLLHFALWSVVLISVRINGTQCSSRCPGYVGEDFQALLTGP